MIGSNVKSLIATFLVAILMLAGFSQDARAQTDTIDWEDAGVPNLGSVPSPTTVTGSDGTTATVNFTVQTSGTGPFVPSFGTDFLSYFTGDIGGSTQPLLLNFDNSSYDPNDKVTTTFTLSAGVKGLQFTLSDIDQGSFTDAIEIYYDDGSGSFINAASTTAFWTANSTVVRTNDSIVNGWRGSGGSATAATDGNLAFNFGSTTVERIRIVYFSYSGTGDPTGQFTGISDFSYTAPGADLSLTKQLVGNPPVNGGTATYRLTVFNSAQSTQSGTGITVQDTFPSQFSFASASGTGGFNEISGIWTIPSLAPGESASIDLQGTISGSSGTSVTNAAEIISSNETDGDSTPNNGVTTEDDYDSVSFSVQPGRVAGIPPVLSCPNGSAFYDWDNPSISWTAGSTNNSYPFSSYGDVNFAISNPGAYFSSANFGGQSPTLQTTFNGGLVPVERSLAVLVNQTSQAANATITITLPRGFEGLQFTIFDVDFTTGQFADRVVVTGSNGATAVTPTLTNGNNNYVSGNTAIGDVASDSDSGAGNLVVTFTDKVDTIVITYGNHTTAPDNPGIQGISVHDIEVCRPFTTLNVTKISSVISDPVNGATNPKAIPGSLIEYLITVSNSGDEPTDPDTVVVTDDAPPDAKMCLADLSGQGPVTFTDIATSSDLTYTYIALDNAGDDLEFSSDGGTTWTYDPTADADGCDSAISDFRVSPAGAFAASGSFTLKVRFIVE